VLIWGFEDGEGVLRLLKEAMVSTSYLIINGAQKNELLLYPNLL
jgi:hypothetical protein